jgi:hypothetical protein
MAVTDYPTPKQLAFLRTLADRTGMTFARPLNRAAASREIDRLLHADRSSRAERRNDARPITTDGRRALYAPRVREHELAGYGADTHWKGRGR